MQFWTALQYPLCQAALVRDGEIIRRIPAHPPRTPARRVVAIGEFDGLLVVGRRTSVELWTADGRELLQSVYHPWIYSLHACLQLGSCLLLACATLDVVFTLDFEGRSSWSWWAHNDGLSAKPAFINDHDWETVQITQEVEHDTAHLNSIRLADNGTVLATLLKRSLVVEVDLNDPHPKSKVLRQFAEADVHDFQYHKGTPIFGARESLVLGSVAHPGYLFVKRIVPLSDGRYLFTHEEGVTAVDSGGARLLHWTLPRPFGLALIET